MEITPDEIVYWQWGILKINATLAFSWALMAVLVGGSWLVTRRLTSGPDLSKGQNMLEVIVQQIREQIREATREDPDRYLPFVGTLFLFIVVANVLSVVPGFEAPTAFTHLSVRSHHKVTVCDRNVGVGARTPSPSRRG